jgi:hypothetical protein
MNRLWCGLVLLLCLCPALAQSPNAIRAEVATLLTAAQDALKAKDPTSALEKLQAASAVPQLNGNEAVLLNRLRVVAGIDGGKPLVALAALDALIAAPEVPAAEKPSLIENSISILQKQKNHSRVLEACKLYGTLAAPKRGILLAEVQALYFLKNYAMAITQINALIQQPVSQTGTSATAITTPEEYVLRMLADSHQQLKNKPGYLESLVLLLTYYPSPSYWSDYLARHINQLEANSPYELDWYRLMRATQSLQEADDFMVYSRLALKFGLPQEALFALELGIKAGQLGTAANKAASDALRQQIARRITEDAASLELLEKQAPTAVNGNAAAQLGDLHMANGHWAQAQAAYQRAVEKGGVRREELARLHWGMAFALQNQKDTALEVFAWKGFDPSARALAKAWALWSNKTLK